MKGLLSKYLRAVFVFADRWPMFFRYSLGRGDKLADYRAKDRSINVDCGVAYTGDRKLRVVFLCHMPALWSKSEPIYKAMSESEAFDPVVVTVPQGDEPDDSIVRWLAGRGVKALPGKLGARWISLKDLAADYVFHAVPYSMYYPAEFAPSQVAKYARLCYVPYVGQLIYAGGVADTTHDPSYFMHNPLAFLSDEEERRHLAGRTDGGNCSGHIVTGSPQLERIIQGNRGLGRRGEELRVLWTPRWHSKEGNCHFFDHKDLLLDLVEGESRLHLTFRPHPLCLANFLRTGELSREEHDRLLRRIDALPNAELDSDGDYLATMERTDIFVSDMSSVLADFFVTGKPIIYTHRVDSFNELGRFMSGGFYWVRSPDELRDRLLSLARGHDPLRERRLALRQEYLSRMPTGSVTRILDAIRRDSAQK